VTETVTPHLLMREQPLCSSGGLTGFMLIITNGQKKSWCFTHWEVITAALNAACNAAAWFSLTTVSMVLSSFFSLDLLHFDLLNLFIFFQSHN